MPGVSVKLENLTVVFNRGTPNEIFALKDINLEITPGEIIVLTGGNGSGKSTLLKVIGGIIKPTEGSVLIDGVAVSNQKDFDRAKEVSFVHQDPLLGTCPNLTLFENMTLSDKKKWWIPFPYGLNVDKEKAHALKKSGLGLEKRMSLPLSNFSGGQRQAIAIAIEFSHDAGLVLLDEFTSSLDETTSANVFGFSFEYARTRGATLVMVMHKLNQVVETRCTILTLADGAIIQKVRN